MTPSRSPIDTTTRTMQSIAEQDSNEREHDFVALENTPGNGAAQEVHVDIAANATSNTKPSSCQRFIDNELPTICSIGFFAYCGVGVRVLLTELGNTISSKQNELLMQLGNSFFLANVLGCFVMGFCVRSRNVLPKKHFKDLMTGITTGFCGCCTTFASLDLFVAKKFVTRHWADALLVVFVQIACALWSFYGGCHCAEALLKFYIKQTQRKSQTTGILHRPLNDLPRLTALTKRNVRQLQLVSSPQQHHPDEQPNNVCAMMTFQMNELSNCLTKSLDQVSALSQVMQQEESSEQAPQFMVKHHGTILFLIATIVFWLVPWFGQAVYPKSLLLAVAVAPYGALIRYYLSLFHAQPRFQSFPLFTFIVNVGASVLTCAAEIVGSKIYPNSQHARDLFMILGSGMFMTGFLGSLSTVSTWINELDALAGQHTFWAYRYGLATLVIAQLCSVFMLSMWQTYGSAPLV